jgi:glutathione synthase/RimK-type ligase-like ATP-grasp enzyme
VGECLRAAKAGVFVLDAPSFPESTRARFDGSRLVFSGRRVALPGCVYLRGMGTSPLLPGLDADLRERPRGLIAQCEEKRAFLESVFQGWDQAGVPIVNSLAANAQHGRKPLQLQMLESAGLPVPRWTATNDPNAVRRFAQAVGRCVYKPLAGGATVRLVEKADLTPERLSALALAPVLFQERVEGVSVRAFVAGRRVVAAAEIHSAELDYRRGEESVTPTRLTPDEQAVAVRAARACGMRFTGVDLVRGRGRFALLECNPSPMFAVFEQKTGLDVATPLAALLVSLATRRRQ